MTDRATTLFELASDLARETADFQAVRGAGHGDHATLAFMRELRARALRAFGADHSECALCGDTAFAADFYFPDEATVVEIALGLPNPASEFEKDILKSLVAREQGHPITRLYFISRPGAVKKCDQPGRTAIKAWALKHHGLSVEIRDLPGEPRKRKRKPRG